MSGALESGSFASISEELRSRFSTYLSTHLTTYLCTRLKALSTTETPCEFYSACEYVLNSGGKYVRPLLVYCAGKSIAPQLSLDSFDAPAAAVELVHSYSLVHDDLPAMDDDDLRRGKPTVHTAFDEATAILVGDALQALAFELLATAPGLSAEQKVAMVAELAQAAGASGMVGGQYIDIQATDSNMNLPHLRTMHELKTGAMIRAALAIGGIAAAASEQQLRALDSYGRHIGLAFQVVDDLLDVQGDATTLGKTGGKDSAANKPTYVKLLGEDGARQESLRLRDEALASLEEFGKGADTLRELAGYIVDRDH